MCIKLKTFWTSVTGHVGISVLTQFETGFVKNLFSYLIQTHCIFSTLTKLIWGRNSFFFFLCLPKVCLRKFCLRRLYPEYNTKLTPDGETLSKTSQYINIGNKNI